MQMIIRPAQITDAASLARVRVETWRTAYRGIIPEATLAAMDLQKETARWDERLRAPLPDSYTFAAEVRTEPDGAPLVAGFCGVGSSRDAAPEYSGELYAIYVLQAYQGQGIGRALVQAGVDWLRQRGHRSMIIWVLRDNHPSRRFYEVLGGTAVRSRSITIGGAELPETGYGYNLSRWQDQ